jgi:single stranded DNA-binding protein
MKNSGITMTTNTQTNAVNQNINSVNGSGRLGADPVIRYVETKNGAKAVATMSVAVYINPEKTDWYNIQCWEKLAEIVADKLKKGVKISFEGRLKIDSYEKEGELFLNPVVVASEINF